MLGIKSLELSRFAESGVGELKNKRPDVGFGFKIKTKITLVWVNTQELFYELKSEASYGRQGCRRQGN